MDEAYEKLMHELKANFQGYVESSWEKFVKHCEEENIQAPSAYGFKEWLVEELEK